MEFQSPPTSLTDEEAEMRADFQKRVDFTHDLNDASDFLKWHWWSTPVSPVPLEIKTHVLEDDPVVARHEFEARSLFLEGQHSPEEGRTFEAFGRRHEATTQHYAQLTFRNGTVKYVVVWIEKDAEVTTPELEPVRHSSTYGAHYNRTYVRCECGWEDDTPSGLTAVNDLGSAYRNHVNVEMNAEVTETNEDTVWHSAFYDAKHNRSYVTCDCGNWEKSVPTDITARGKLEAAYREHRDAEVTTDA